MKTDSVHLTVTKDVAAANQEQWLAYATELATETWKEDGCISYDFVRSKDNPERFVIVEEWASQAHLDAHAASLHFQKLVPLMDAISTTIELDVSTKALSKSREPTSDRTKRNGRVLILYDTSTGSTEDMAVLIAEGVQLLDRMDVRIRVVPGEPTSWEDPTKQRDVRFPFATFSDVYWADAVAAGTPTNLGCISYRMKKFWDDFSQQGGWSTTDGKIGTAFTSQGGHGGGGELACMAMQTVLLNFGFSIFGITDYVGFLDTMHYGSAIAKKPRNEMDQMKCRRQGLRLAEFVAYYINGRDEAHPMFTKEWETKRWGFPGIPPKRADSDEICERTAVPHVSLQKKPCFEELLKKKKALIFTKMEDYVHDSTPAMAAWVLTKLMEFGWEGVVTDDSSCIESKEELCKYDMVVFLNNSGQIFQENEALLEHIQKGKSVVGVHAAVASFLNGKDASGATIMEPTSDIFENIFGSHFQNHPPVQTGLVTMEQDGRKNKLAPWLASIPSKFTHTDEFFNFTKNVSDIPDVNVIAWVDESTYEGGLMGDKHPIAWYRDMGEKNARIFYSGLGHFSHFYNGTGPNEVSIILEAGLRYCCGY
uniref:ABM domain-containing protein n=1 Tax=Amphora coffeiformis TaxID=265554 RepID=A0A7S3LA89_9STRA|mmetsp:Transcript_14812/g.28211  ORF Transcript_14812/g.28211 Transcript_14812/m.28211 type:complete len:594 (-) Transcript_14812:51-1832(-)|eukprot:scaffold45806_cov237-Amphora_coffeaeformis.AAC.4